MAGHLIDHHKLAKAQIALPKPSPAPPPSQPQATTASTLTPDQALATINTVVVQDTFIIGGMAILISLVAIVGVGALVSYARSIARDIARTHASDYMSGPEHTENVRRLVVEEIRVQLENKLAVIVQPPPQAEGSKFPQAPTREASDGNTR